MVCLESYVISICGKQAFYFFGAFLIRSLTPDYPESFLMPFSSAFRYLLPDILLKSNLKPMMSQISFLKYSSSDLLWNSQLSWNSCLIFLHLLSLFSPVDLHWRTSLPVPVVSVQYELPAFTSPFMYLVPFLSLEQLSFFLTYKRSFLRGIAMQYHSHTEKILHVKHPMDCTSSKKSFNWSSVSVLCVSWWCHTNTGLFFCQYVF